MVSTRSRTGISKEPEAGPSMPASNNLNLAAILEGQAKMQQELTDFKKRNVGEMEALRQKNSRLRKKIKANPTQKGKGKEVQEDSKTLVHQTSEEGSEYNPTPHTFTTTHHTSTISAHHATTHHTPTLPANHPTTHHPPTPHHYTTTFPTII